MRCTTWPHAAEFVDTVYRRPMRIYSSQYAKADASHIGFDRFRVYVW